jgi:hypothetical protein
MKKDISQAEALSEMLLFFAAFFSVNRPAAPRACGGPSAVGGER